MNYFKGMTFLVFFILSSTTFAQFVKVDGANSQHFLDHNGFPLQIHGINRFAIYESKDNQNDMDVEQYFKYLANNRFNLVRVFVREGYVKEGRREIKIPLESELGIYNDEHLREIDRVFLMAKKYQVYVILCMFDHYYLNRAWVSDVLSSPIPIDHPTPYYLPKTISDQFYSDPNLRVFAKKRVAFLADRYKDEKYLFAWEPMNEVNGVLKNNYTTENTQVLDWYEDMGSTIRANDPNHLISLSLTADLYYTPNGEYKPWTSFYKSLFTDIIQIHSYGFDGPKWQSYLYGDFEHSIIFAKNFNKPVMLAEFSVRSDNSKRNEIIKAIYQLAKKNDLPAMLWTHRYDQFGDLNSDLIKIYHDIFFQKEE